MLHVLRNQFLWYLSGDMMLGILVALVFYRLLQPIVLNRVFRPRVQWSIVWPILGGALCALIPLGLTVLVALVAGEYSPHTAGYVAYEPFIHEAYAPPGWMVWLFFLVQSSFEELLFRGVGLALLATLLVWAGRMAFAPHGVVAAAAGASPSPARLWFACGLLANLVIAVAFGSIHQDNPHATLFAVANIALAGFALGQLFWLQRNLWGACAMHTVWNAVLATFGLPVSGLVARGPLLGNIHGSVEDILTGGSFGPEASAVTTAGLLLVSLWLVWRTWQATLAVEQSAALEPDVVPALPGVSEVAGEVEA